MKQKQITGYHFTSEHLRDGRPIPVVGEWLKHEGEIIACFLGLHASEHPFDALQYAPGNLLHQIVLRGSLESHGEPADKYVGRERKILATINAEVLLRDFARWSALQVIHLWDAPPVVREFLETGKEELQNAAWSAAWSAAWAVAQNAAQSAARDAARDAAWSAAWAAFALKARQEFQNRVTAAFAKLP